MESLPQGDVGKLSEEKMEARLPDYQLRDFDLCVCGDYRHQHSQSGHGPSRLNDLNYGGRKCLRFRLASVAKGIPAFYARHMEKEAER